MIISSSALSYSGWLELYGYAHFIGYEWLPTDIQASRGLRALHYDSSSWAAAAE